MQALPLFPSLMDDIVEEQALDFDCAEVYSHGFRGGPTTPSIIDIKSLSLIEGKLPQRALSLTLDWAELHQAELLEDWQLCQDMQNPKPIAPLE